MLADYIERKMSGSSWIRAMFEEGEKLRKVYGADKVYDFSLGNPDLEPPTGVTDELKRLVESNQPNLHKYMSNAGFPDVRAKVASHIQKESGVQLSEKHIIMRINAGAYFFL